MCPHVAWYEVDTAYLGGVLSYPGKLDTCHAKGIIVCQHGPLLCHTKRDCYWVRQATWTTNVSHKKGLLLCQAGNMDHHCVTQKGITVVSDRQHGSLLCHTKRDYYCVRQITWTTAVSHKKRLLLCQTGNMDHCCAMLTGTTAVSC